MIYIDFETLPIEPRPDYPPKPVAVSVIDGRKRHFAYGTADMKKLLRPYFNGKQELCFHNAAFDVSVAVEGLGMPMPGWRHIHDTKFLLFLHDPYKNLSLKPACAEILGISEEDQTELKEWIYGHIPEAKGKKEWGKWIGFAPRRLIEKRAHGDTMRTRELYLLLEPKIRQRGMMDAYDRERRLLPMLLENSRAGVRVDRTSIFRDTEQYEAAMLNVDAMIRKRLKAPGLNPGSPDELVAAIEKAGKGSNWLITPGGKKSAAKNSILQAITDKKLLQLVQYRGKIETALSTFLRKWCVALEKHDRLHTEWNQVKGEGAGAATGRKSSRPNFQNIPKGLKHDDLLELGLPALPKFRTYFLPEEGEVWVRRDYSQQELRILAHMEGGALLKLYQKDPRVDLHQYAADALKHLDLMREEVQIKVNRYDDPRGIAKMIAFSLLYGMGNGELAYRLGVEESEARNVRNAYLSLWPGIKDLQNTLKYRAAMKEPITTWGGRQYYCQEPRFVDGRIRSFDYKLLNYLIQGSAADCTKEGLCRLWEAGLPGRFLLSVHDEISWSLKKKDLSAAKDMGAIMRSVEFDVPMLSDCEVGQTWGKLEKRKDLE